jgi:hypothetical protein
MQRFDLRNPKVAEVKKENQVKISKWFRALKHFNCTEDIGTVTTRKFQPNAMYVFKS